MTTRDLLTDSLHELNVLAAGESLSASDAALMLGKLNRLLDNWNAERAAVYVDRFDSYTLVPSLSPHTIGPTGATFTVTQRPVKIDGANLVLNTSTPDVRTPICIRDAAWYQELSVPDLTGSIPTDVYYEPAWPNGRLFFWPIPTTAYDVELQTRIVLASLELDTVFSMPPGYQDAITLTLAEQVARSFGAVITEDLRFDARNARARIFANNDETPRLTSDAPESASNGRPSFNYLTGLSQ
jgi:hypothetical protein